MIVGLKSSHIFAALIVTKTDVLTSYTGKRY